MDEREQKRLRLVREVGKLLHLRSFRDALPPLREDGSRPFVVGLPRTLWPDRCASRHWVGTRT